MGLFQLVRDEFNQDKTAKHSRVNRGRKMVFYFYILVTFASLSIPNYLFRIPIKNFQIPLSIMTISIFIC
jgi:hypothetical protein